MIHFTDFLKGGGSGGGGVLEEGATIVRGYFAKILLPLPPSLARSQAA